MSKKKTSNLPEKIDLEDTSRQVIKFLMRKNLTLGEIILVSELVKKIIFDECSPY